VSAVHQKLAVAIVLLALGGFLWSGYLAYRGRESHRLQLLAGITAAAVGLQALFGIVLTILGNRPTDPLHYLYGPVTVLALLLTLRPRSGRTERASRIILCAGWLAVLALSLRAVGTGGGLR
jgi:heme A synthase